MNKLKVKISDIKVGKWVRVIWDDVGARDSLVVEDVNKKHYKEIKVYSPFSSGIELVSLDQIVKVGKYFRINGPTGLD